MKVGPILKELRRRKKLSAQEVADASGIEIRNYYKLEKKELNIRMDTLLRVLEAMGCTLKDIHDIQKESTKKKSTSR